MAQTVNRELIENLRPFIVRIANEAIGAYDPQNPGNSSPYLPNKGGIVIWDSVHEVWYRNYMHDRNLYVEIIPGVATEPIVPIPPERVIIPLPEVEISPEALNSVALLPTNDPAVAVEPNRVYPTKPRIDTV